MLRLLIGLRNPRIAGALSAHGFTERDLKEGWTRLSALTTGRLAVPQIPARDPRVIAELDAFENYWFPVVRATLTRHYPKVAGSLFLNLSQISGAEVAVSVSTLLARLGEMEAGEAPYGDDGPEAHELLRTRGLTDDVIREAAALIARVQSFREGSVQKGPSPDPHAAAEAELWSWYLEWGTIARTAISDGRLLRELGFLQTSNTKEDETDDSLDTEVESVTTEQSAQPS
ncbi:MAG TPA: hypothetical protein VF989_16890 [Polyangiaceae bacterium]